MTGLVRRSHPVDERTQLKALLAAQRPRHSLDQAFYTDADLFRLDLDLIFARQWLFAGLTCELPAPGDYLTVTVGASAILVCRDRAGEIRAFHNTCRHRGSQLCDAERGRRSTFVCPYHQWSYDLTGRLVRAPNMGESFDRDGYGLKRVHVAVIEGVIFICLAATPPDLDAFRAALAPALAPHRLACTKVVKEIVIDEKANWKLVWENARECDHCAVGHPELMKTLLHFNLEDPWSDPYIGPLWQRWEASGLPSTTREGPGFRVGRIPLQPGRQSITLDGRPAVSRRLGDWPDQEIGSLRFAKYPTVFSHVHADYAIVVQISPVGPQETKVTCRWVVHEEAVEGVDYDLERLLQVWRDTNVQDQRFCERNQRGVNSRGYQPGPYAMPSEYGVWAFTDWYCTELAQALDADRG